MYLGFVLTSCGKAHRNRNGCPLKTFLCSRTHEETGGGGHRETRAGAEAEEEGMCGQQLSVGFRRKGKAGREAS